MLDYKIKDLKREIMPQLNEILELKNATKDLDNLLKKFNQTNAGLALTIDDNRQKQTEMLESNKKARATIRRNETYIASYRNAVYWVAQKIDDFDELREAFDHYLKPYFDMSSRKQEDIDKDIKKEF